MNDNPFKPPSTPTKPKQSPGARVRSGARWMRILGSVHLLVAAPLVALAIACALKVAQQPGVAFFFTLVCGTGATLLAVFAVWLFRAAARLRRGLEQGSATVMRRPSSRCAATSSPASSASASR